MTKIKIYFFHWESFYGKLIQFATRSKWTHVGIGVENGDSFTIYEAVNRGLVKSNYPKETLKRWEEQGIVTSKDVFVARTNKEIVATCDKYLGRSYDWTSIFFIGVHFIFGKYALNFTGSRKLICSEFVARALYDLSDKQINFATEYNKPYDFVTPADIYNSKQLK